MDKLLMCRICLVENVRMRVVVNKNLHELYEKLTDVPFVTEDSRPLLACFICFTKLKQCYQLLSRCTEAEKLFSQINNKSFVNRGQLQHHSGLIRTPIHIINIVGGDETDNLPIKQELPDYNEMQHDVIEPKEEYLSDELETDSGDQLPLLELKIEVEEKEIVFEKEQRASETEIAAAAKKPKLEDTITANHEEDEQAHASIARNQHLTTEHVTTFKEPFADTQPAVNNSINDTASNTKDINSDLKLCKEKLYKCDICPRTFVHYSRFQAHNIIHTGEKLYECDICQRSFSRSSSLKEHMRIHSSEQVYKCDKCPRSFNHSSNLKTHIRIHTAQQPYMCDICQRGFNQLCSLKRHLNRLHNGIQPYNCDICHLSFSDKCVLNKHIRVHAVEKLYKCDFCQCCFTQELNLAKHVQKHKHKEIS